MPEVRAVPGWPVHTIFTVLGLILVAAAGLKGYQLATGPVAENDFLSSRWLLVGLVEWELGFGLWLLAGLAPQRTRLVALACFAAFAGFSLYQILTGKMSCGCFGRVSINPWYTFTLDLAAVLALVASRSDRSVSFSSQRLAAWAGLVVFLGLPGALAMASFTPAVVDEAGSLVGDSQTVVFEPSAWIGKPLPLLRHIDIGSDLAKGDWIVLLYHLDCPVCREVIAEYERLSRCSAPRLLGAELALVECPPYHSSLDTAAGLATGLRYGRVKEQGKEWFIKTPVTLRIRDGRLITLSDGRGATLLGSRSADGM